jgi:hypothetical protein
MTPMATDTAGGSVLKSWDFAFDDEVDRPAVAAYVAEAVARVAPVQPARYAQC